MYVSDIWIMFDIALDCWMKNHSHECSHIVCLDRSIKRMTFKQKPQNNELEPLFVLHLTKMFGFTSVLTAQLILSLSLSDSHKLFVCVFFISQQISIDRSYENRWFDHYLLLVSHFVVCCMFSVCHSYSKMTIFCFCLFVSVLGVFVLFITTFNE